jgi:hypothetical protein
MPTSTIPPAMNHCQNALAAIRTFDFRGWQGLPADCDWQELTGPLPTDWTEVYARSLGTSFRPAHQVDVNLSGYTKPHLYFVAGKPVLFEAMAGPILVAWEELLKDLGEPAARLDWDFGTLPIKASEYVYPARGITLFLNTDKDRALHIALFAPTTLDAYLADLRPSYLKKRLPYRR